MESLSGERHLIPAGKGDIFRKYYKGKNIYFNLKLLRNQTKFIYLYICNSYLSIAN